MPVPELKASSCSLRLRRALITVAQIVVVTAVVGWVLNHTAGPGPTSAPAGFGLGMLHGALMPAALPNLLAGFDVQIYAVSNTGLPYKLGYAMGVNVCGFFFFGILFWQIQLWRKKKVLPPPG